MEERELLPTQKDFFVELLEKYYPIADFLFQDSREKDESGEIYYLYKIIYKKNRGLYFYLSVYPTIYEINFRPEIEESNTSYLRRHDWKSIMAAFEIWSANVQIQLDAGNLWERSKNFISEPDGEMEIIFDDNPFAPDELKLLSTNAEKLKSELQTVKELSADRLKALEEKVDELVQMAKEGKTITKIKWKELFINSLLGFLIRSAVPQETFNKIMGIVFKGVKFLISVGTGHVVF